LFGIPIPCLVGRVLSLAHQLPVIIGLYLVFTMYLVFVIIGLYFTMAEILCSATVKKRLKIIRSSPGAKASNQKSMPGASSFPVVSWTLLYRPKLVKPQESQL
jgi:hypothetical protein